MASRRGRCPGPPGYFCRKDDRGQSQAARPVPIASATLANPSRARRASRPFAMRGTSDSRDRPSRCIAARPRPRRGSWHRPARARRCRRRRSGAACLRSACDSWASTRVDFSNSGAPDRPPASPRFADFRPSRDSVVLVAMMPDRPEASATSAIWASSPSVRSGAIFRKTGIGVAGWRAPPSPRPEGRRARRGLAGRAVSRCWGSETLTVAKSTCGPQRGQHAGEIGGAVVAGLVGAKVQADRHRRCGCGRPGGRQSPPSRRC